MCLCSTIAGLAVRFDPDTAVGLAAELSSHLGAIRSILSRSKALARDVGFQVVPSNQRTAKILSARPSDPQRAVQLCQRYADDARGFWAGGDDDLVPADLRRRLACMVVDVRSSLDGGDAQTWVPPGLAGLVQGHKPAELRYAGKKYIKMGRKLGGVGSMLWLPFEVPSSTYERYLNMDDDEAFRHLRTLGSSSPDNDALVQRLIASQLGDPAARFAACNLYDDYGDLFSRTDRLLLLLAALGGSCIPVDLLRALQKPRRRWGPDAEMHAVTPQAYGFSPAVVDLAADRALEQAAAGCAAIEQRTLADGGVVWSLREDTRAALAAAATPRTRDVWAATALRLLCYACPLCYEGQANWPRETKQAVWALLDRATDQARIAGAAAQRTQVLDALLFFAERDIYATRRVAVARARALLQPAMPFYYDASVTLFESILLRLEGRFDASSAHIRAFLDSRRGGTPGSRCDNALRGRLHVSWIENKVHRYEPDAGAVMYDWAGIVPLSTFEIEVTRRLQGTAAKYFHSVGDFAQAQASLEQHLALFAAQPIRANTRLLITTKLAEIHCELRALDQADALLQREMATLGTIDDENKRRTRPWRRLAMVSVEVALARQTPDRLDAAEATLRQLERAEPPELDDLNDQVLRMRRLLLVARTAHVRGRYQLALDAWQHAAQQMRALAIFAQRHPWTPVVLHLSAAHAHLCLGHVAAAEAAWAQAAALAATERCEYVLPALATAWVPHLVDAVRQQQPWPFRMMLPGGRPDVTW